MPFKEAPFNTTLQVKGGNRITGSRDAIFIRNKYQTELDNAHASFVNMIHHVEDNERWKAIDFLHKAQGLKQDIESHKSERVSLYAELRDTLSKELDFQKWMRSRTEKMASATTKNLRTNIQRVDDSSEINIEAVTDFLKVNPEHASTPSIISLTGSIKEKEKELRLKEEDYNKVVMLFNREIPYLESDLDKCDKKLIVYQSLLKDWEEKRKNCRYYSSFWFRLLPEENKSELLPDVIKHRIEQFTSTLELFKRELDEYKTHEFSTLPTIPSP
jgi:chromosome segregation ATPase